MASREAVEIPTYVLDRYRAREWTITSHRRPSTGQVMGPCATGCGETIIRYGPAGKANCGNCLPTGAPLGWNLLRCTRCHGSVQYNGLARVLCPPCSVRQPRGRRS